VLFVPLRGVSAIATEGQVFHDAAADKALFDTIRATVDPAKVEVHEVEADVNEQNISQLKEGQPAEVTVEPLAVHLLVPRRRRES